MNFIGTTKKEIQLKKKTNTPYLRFEKILINSYGKAIDLELSSALFKKNNYRLKIVDKMLQIGIIINEIIPNNTRRLITRLSSIFLEGYILLPQTKDFNIYSSKYSNGVLSISLVELSEKYRTLFNKKKRLQDGNYICQNHKSIE